MVSPNVSKQLQEALNRLSPEQQERVVQFARGLHHHRPRGTPGAELARFAGVLDDEAAREMIDIIKRDCEDIDLSTW